MVRWDRLIGLGLALTGVASTHAAPGPQRYDVVIYGGTSSGVAAALQVSRMGKTVAVIEPSKHVGGLSAGGLGATDIGNKAAIGGIAREFYQRLGKNYGQEEAWTFEPRVAMRAFQEMIREARADLFLEQPLASVKTEGDRLTEITTRGGLRFTGTMFIDAGYEGDLMARAGVSYTVGRESNAQYDETLDGVQMGSKSHQFEVPTDPYVVPGDPSSGLLPRIHGDDPGKHGQGDHRIQAYCFRLCMTKDPDNRVAFPRPEGYDPKQYGLLARYLQNADKLDKDVRLLSIRMMPHGKTDTNNNGAFSTDNIGMNYDYPDGDYETRRRIVAEHEVYQKGLMYFLCNDPSVPLRFRQQVGAWGLAKDEFVDNGNWPHQLYIREARRMVSDCVTTQHHCQWREVAEDSVGLGAYNMDSHNCQRYVKDGLASNEGDVQVGVAAPYGISYRSIVPKRGACANLLVPVCVSSSHIAYGSIRMEPVFMVLGQSAATAACLAMDEGVAVQALDYAKLKARLLADKQILVWQGAVRKTGVDPKKLPGLVLDDDLADRTGHWQFSTSVSGYVGKQYLHDGNVDKGGKIARFRFKIDKPGRYDVRSSYRPHANRATNVPIVIHHADGTARHTVNQKLEPKGEHGFITLGTYRFAPAHDAVIEISNAGTDGHVIVDAAQLVFVP